MTHSASKSSKNKKAKQRAKGKVESTDKESWRLENEPTQGNSVVDDGQISDVPSDKTKETKSTSSIESTEIQPRVKAADNDEEDGEDDQDENKGKLALPETVEDNGKKSGSDEISTREQNTAATLEESKEKVNILTIQEVDLAEKHVSEKKQTVVEPVMPLRSRGEFCDVRKLSPRRSVAFCV